MSDPEGRHQLEPGTVVGSYRVEGLLGEGAMAEVYRVTHTALGTEHALKMLTMRRRGVRERFLQEGRVQAGLRHPNIVAVTDVIDAEDTPSLLMELVDGPSLDRWLRDHRPTLDEALAIFRGVVAGVAHAHDAGVVHRDIKPSNVMLHLGDAHPVPKLTDFGLAKIVEGPDRMKQTRTGTTMGTPAYMAPEQIRDASSVDGRADLFSLGCLLYELFVGRPPFRGDDIIELFNAVASADFPPPRELAPDLPDRVVLAIDGLLEVDPARRIPTCAALLEVLEGDAVDPAGPTEPVPAPAPPPVRPLAAPGRALPTTALAVAGGVAVAFAVLGCGGGLLFIAALQALSSGAAGSADPVSGAPEPAGGVRPFDDESVGICVRKPPWGCKRFVGRSALDLPAGDYVLFGAFAVPSDDRKRRWTVTLDYECVQHTTAGDKRSASHKEYRIQWPGPDRGYPVGMLPFRVPASDPTDCTYTIAMPGPGGATTVAGAWHAAGR